MGCSYACRIIKLGEPNTKLFGNSSRKLRTFNCSVSVVSSQLFQDACEIYASQTNQIGMTKDVVV